jgi:hypothetical protein
MRSAVAVVICAACAAFAACTPPTNTHPGGADSRMPDAGRASDGAPLPSCTDTGTPDKPPGATGQLATGVYNITWTPLVGAFDNVNPLLDSDRLTVDMVHGTAHWDSPTCAECAFDHSGTPMDGCLLVPMGMDGSTTRDAYWLCSTATGTIADITWCGYPGPPDPRTWRATGTP